MMGTLAETLRLGVRTLAQRSGSPELDAEVLLSAVLGISRSALIVQSGEVIAGEALEAYRNLLDRRAHGEPVAYLTGRREFWSLPLKITPSVLVPRHETELLVELALRVLPKSEPRRVLDLGTGSGAVALAIASERPRAQITGIDVSPAALGVARDNSRSLSLANVDWRLGSWFDAVPGERFDVIVANPPYVADGDPALPALAAEPALALLGGPHGLDALAAIIPDAARHLEPGGWLLLEHGSTQSAEVARLLDHQGFREVRSQTDYAGLPRVTLGTLHSAPQGHS
jgi:release factor glutamine methyltransferase